jgi:hypothetical protein
MSVKNLLDLGKLLFHARCIRLRNPQLISAESAPFVYRQVANAAAVKIIAAAKQHGIVGSPQSVDVRGDNYAYVLFSDGGIEFDPSTVWVPGALSAKRA